jgi:hypothetical protein
MVALWNQIDAALYWNGPTFKMFVDFYKKRMEVDSAEEQWGIFLKKKIPENLNEEKINFGF